MTDRRNRHRFFFWLDADKDDDLLLMEAVDEMKAARVFTRCIRDGLRLVWSLRRGDTSVLYELFPWIQDNRLDRNGVLELLREYDEYRRQSSAYAEDSFKRGWNEAMSGEVYPIETLYDDFDDDDIETASDKSFKAKVKVKSIEHVRVTKPLHDDFDDDDIEIDIHKDTRTDSAANFLKSLEALQG